MAKLSVDLEPQVLNLTLYAGDGVNLRLRIKSTPTTPVNLTGTMRAQIRVDRDQIGDPDAEFDIDLTDAVDGLAVVSLTGEQTQELAPTAEKYIGVWDLEWTPEGGEPRTICQGKVECLPDVSH